MLGEHCDYTSPTSNLTVHNLKHAGDTSVLEVHQSVNK